MEQIRKYAESNVRDIMSVGFKPDLTYVFNNFDYRLKNPHYETFVSQMKKLVSIKQLEAIFGLNVDVMIGLFIKLLHHLTNYLINSLIVLLLMRLIKTHILD